jgi:putative oxidoreductase
MFSNKTSRFTSPASFLLVLLFVYTGTSKLLGYQTFQEQLFNISYLKPFAGMLSIALPVVEILTGFAIALKMTLRIGLWSAAILMTAFTIYVAVMLSDDKAKLPCSCGGVIKALTWKKHLYFNIFFMLLAWASLILTGTRKKGVS